MTSECDSRITEGRTSDVGGAPAARRGRSGRTAGAPRGRCRRAVARPARRPRRGRGRGSAGDGRRPSSVRGLDEDVGPLHGVASAGVADDDRLPAAVRTVTARPGRRGPVVIPFSSTSRRSAATPLARSTSAAERDGARAPGRRRRAACRRRSARRSRCARPDLAGTVTGLDHEAAGSVVAVDEELPGAHPPEVVHGHDRRGPGRRRRPRRARRRGVWRACRCTMSAGWRSRCAREVLGDRRVVVVALVGPVDPRRGDHPAHREPGVVDARSQLVQRAALAVEAAGEDAHVVAPVAQALGQALRLQRARHSRSSGGSGRRRG